MSYIRANFLTDLQVVKELLPLVKKECGGCLPSALTFEESLQNFAKFENQNNFVVSLLPCDHIECFHQEVVLDVWVLKCMKDIHERGASFDCEPNGGSLTLYLTRELKDYQQLKKERCYFLKQVEPIPIKRITIGALSVEAFQWAKTDLKAFLMNTVEQRLVIVRQNGNLGEMFIESDLYNKLSMLIILECVPVMQGLLTANTMLVVCDIHRDNLDKWSLKRVKSMQGSGKVPHLPSLKMPPNNLRPTSYQTISLDEPDIGILKKDIGDVLSVSLLEYPYHCINLPEFDHIVDVDNKIWLTKATMTHMQLNMGTWVRVKTCSRNFTAIKLDSPDTTGMKKEMCKVKLTQVFPIEERQQIDCIWQDQNSMIYHSNDDQFLNGTAYISPTFFFNIISSPLINIKSVSLHLERAELRESPPCFAQDFSISIISSPLYKTQNMYDVAISKHFAQPRLVSMDDVIAIYCDWKDLEYPYNQTLLDDGVARNHILYCKVTKLSADEYNLSYFVDSIQSKLFQSGGTIQSYIPTAAENFAKNSVPQISHQQYSYWLTTHPGGLECHVKRLENTLRSLLMTCDKTDVFPILVTGPPGVGKRTVVLATSRLVHLQVVEINCYDICGDTTAATEARLRNFFEKAFSTAPCLMLMTNIHCLDVGKSPNDNEPRIVATLMLNFQDMQKNSDFPILLVGTTSKVDTMSTDLRSCFLDEIEIQAPTEPQRIDMLQALSKSYLIGPGVSFETLASHTAGMVLADFSALFSEAVTSAYDDVMSYCTELGLLTEEKGNDLEYDYSNFANYQTKSVDLQKDICSAGLLLQPDHFAKAITTLQSAHSDSIGAPKIPNVSWKDIGGLGHIKDEILDTIQLPFQYPELFATGLQRSGILLYGPPGTGKTLVAKAVATECSLNFISVKGPELINMYVGQSEQNVREIFATAAMAAPCVIFFDELDSLAPNRGRSGDSGGVMDRVVSQLLAELDGIQKSQDVFVIGATNRPDLLDTALLRPGRFDTLLYLGICKEQEDRVKIMKALTRKFHMSEDVSLDNIVSKCPDNLTGADFYALCSNALLKAIKRQIDENKTDVKNVELIQRDFEVAIQDLVPSVSQSELQRYEQIRVQFNKEIPKTNGNVEKVVEDMRHIIGELELDGKMIRK